MVKKKVTYVDVINVLLEFAFCFFLSKSIGIETFFSVPFYLSLLYNGLNPFTATAVFILSFLPSLNVKILLASIITSAFCLFVFLLYKKKKKTMGAELIIYSTISLLSFIFIVDSASIIFNLIEACICIVLVFVFISSTKVVFLKQFNYKCSLDELLCLAIFAILLLLGIHNVFNANTVKAITIFICLFCLSVFNGKVATCVCILLSLSSAVSTKSLTPLAVFPLLILSASTFYKQSKLLSALTLILVDLAFMLLFKVYGSFSYEDVFYTIVPCVLFLITPSFLINSLSKKTQAIENKVLSKYAINRNRIAISSKLYGIADVFMQMKQSFSALQNCVSTDEDFLYKMADEVLIEVCEKCPSYLRCKQRGYPDKKELIKILSIGIAKNRISLIDLTKSFTENCGYVNGVIFEMNALITKYREKVRESEDILSGKELIKMQSEGVANMLKGMAIEFSKTLSFHNELEKRIGENLRRKGIEFSEIMVFNSSENIEVNVVINKDDLFNSGLLDAVSECLNKSLTITSKTAISSKTVAVSIKASPCYDAAFGLASAVKNGSSKSGDTHALTKIDEGKFLIALSDGMGSGKMANSTSSTAISLIESFYKAGLESNLILNMVNKVLTLNTDDNFSAMDILTVNLFNLTGDFIKIGAPYSFILADSSIKIIEGNSLPLGILDDLTPTGCSYKINEGDVIIMITDGISDAFSSSTDLVDYIRTLDNKNPQLIADSILNKALALEYGVKKDDMTVLAVRIFKKVS
ncbi:MAG: SpoIIE family protein phosphatase [Clostridia bacterium]|nr:SpoIIE family protein phosphatase [Clostridia bacterium]